jgi:hypothetical protein
VLASIVSTWSNFYQKMGVLLSGCHHVEQPS